MSDGLGRSPRELRDEVEQLVRDDLVGPLGGEREELGTDTPPIDRYLLGLLAPRMEPRAGSSTASVPTEDDSDDDENAASDAQPEDELASGGITSDTRGRRAGRKNAPIVVTGAVRHHDLVVYFTPASTTPLRCARRGGHTAISTP